VTLTMPLRPHHHHLLMQVLKKQVQVQKQV